MARSKKYFLFSILTYHETQHQTVVMCLFMKLIFWILVILPFDLAHSQQTNSKTPAGGVILDFPRGRFQENDAPLFFKWTSLQKLNSLTLKIYTTDSNGEYDAKNGLIGKFDFLGDVQTFNWNRGLLYAGYYTWIIESYDDQSPTPVFIDSANFRVEQLKYFDLKTARMGVQVGFTRGKRHIKSDVYPLSYDVTPTVYGVVYSRLVQDDKLFNFQGMISDFILEQASYRTIHLQSDVLYSLSKAQNRLKFYLGPSLRVSQLPLVSTPDGSTVSRKDILLLYPGASIIVQQHFDSQITLYSKFILDTPVYGSNNVTVGLDKLNIEYRAGFLYGLMWPIGLSGEILYHHEASKIQNQNYQVETRMNEVGVLATLIYAF